MTDHSIELTRRKILGSVGAIGVAGAAAGYGTSAYFSDEETFEDNTLVAGELDMKVDWEEHYSDWSDDESEGLGNPVSMSEPSDPTDYTGLPDPSDPLLWVHDDDLSTFMDNTAIEAYPDVDDDGVQDSFSTGEVGSFCEDGADTPEDLDPTGGLRTRNEDTYDQEAGERKPLVNLHDVKPGDFGELTFSMHLCNNPGYVWMDGALREARENGWTEPEANDPDESGNEDDVVTDLDDPVADDIELLNEVQTALWYDGDCDNVLDSGDGGTDGEEADVVIVFDRSGSMSGDPVSEAQSAANTLIDALGPNDQVGLVSFSSSSTLDQGLTTAHQDVQDAVNNLTANGGTNIESGVEQGHEELLDGSQFSGYSDSGNARPGARKIMVFLGDGIQNEGTDVTDDTNISPTQEGDNAKADDIEIFSVYFDTGGGGQSTVEDLASDPASNPEDQYFFTAEEGEDELGDIFEAIGGTVGTGGEEVIFRGTLAETLGELEDGIPLDGDLSTEERACYPGLQTACIGFAWWLPVDHANEIQSDSVSFDVGFYTEQCRHNDGSRQAPETTTQT